MSHKVRKFCISETLVLKNVNFTEVDVDEKDAKFLYLSY